MNTKTTAVSILAAVGFAAFGVTAVAQIQPPTEASTNITSTPGNGCTATANAMRGGNLSARPTNKACDDAPAPLAVVPAQPAVVAAPQPAPAAPVAAAPAPAPVIETQTMAAAPLAPRADRN